MRAVVWRTFWIVALLAFAIGFVTAGAVASPQNSLYITLGSIGFVMLVLVGFAYAFVERNKAWEYLDERDEELLADAVTLKEHYKSRRGSVAFYEQRFLEGNRDEYRKKNQMAADFGRL